MSQLLKGIPIIDWFVRITMGTKNQRDVKRYNKIVDAANALEPEIRRLTDAQLRAKTDEFRTRIAGGEKPYTMIPEIFAVAREAMDRGVGIRSIFNPARNADLNQDGLVDANDRFDPSLLPADVRKLYDDTVAVIASTPARAPEGDLCGNAEPVPSWQFVDIPNAIYEAVRTIYPESRPPFRARPFDVQLIGGIVLAEGKIAEMKTGEGKTIVGPLACYLAACEKKQVHVVTVNDYLVQRDRDWTWPFFRALGLTVGAIHPQHMQGHEEKKAAYSCDVVYGTTSEFGFDYLRDNMKTRPEEQLQKRRGFAIVDEVDSILIDEARTPLIISGAAHASQPRYDIADQIARHLVNRQSDWQNAEAECQKLRERIAALDGDMRNARDKSSVPGMKSAQEAARKELATAEARRDRFKQFYEVELDKKQASLTHDGVEEAQRYAKTLDSKIGSFYVGDNIDLPHLVEQSVRAHTVYQRDRDYVVAADENGQSGVVIVDQNTGRKMVGRQWSDGLHQAVEAKEKVKIKEETQTMATITIQNYFKLYERLSGMTGTADTEATEFHEIYSLDVVSIPTNLPIARFDRQDRVYLSQKDKWNAIVEEIKLFHDVGRPVLVGTTSVEKSEMVSRMLQAKYQIKHEVLNAKQHEREAEIVLGAGNLGGVMIATNMAGRGTDIKLRRFTREELVEHWKRRNVAPREARADMPDDEITGLCYRHLAERAFGKDAIAGKDAPALRLMLLRKWAVERAKITEKKADSLPLEQLVELLDEVGYPPLHRVAMWSGVEAMGGLHIVGTERHESRRIDNQLRGRAGRQGDNGSSRFFLSMEDDLMKLFAGKAMLTALSTLGMKEGDDLEAGMLTRSIEKAQRKVEERNFQSRKNILEFDEPMEHQRRAFYGMRQPIVESRNVKETVLRYLEESIDKAADDYLGAMHVPNTVSEWVRENCGVSIAAERFLKKDQEEIEKLIRIDAAEEAQESIRATAGECLPAELEPAEWDAENFASWARTHYGAELLPQEIRSLGSEAAIERVQKAAIRKFAEVDLSPIGAFLVPGFGARQLAQWANRKFGANLDEQVFAGATTPAEAAEKLVAKALEIYRQRELGYQIDFAIESTNSALAQDPAGALAQFCGYVKARYGLEWDPTALPSNDPVELRRMLLDRAGAIGDADNAARVNACLARGRDADSIAQWFAEECLVRLSESERSEATADPDGFVRRKVADLVRLELTQFERWILLQILDNAWKDNLHSMDQIRDAIGFRAFSQKDPRIEFKRESARTFNEMQETIRDRVTDIAFRGRLSAQAPRPTPRPQAVPAAAAAAAAPLAAAQGGAPAMLAPSAAPAAAAPAAAPALGTGAPVDPSTLPVVGRNEPCPCGSGLKYRQCHGKKPDAQA
jgi:preprotein translocase subunit SecA